MSTENEAGFGEIFLHENGSLEAVLPCVFAAPMNLQTIVQDKSGRSVLTQAYSVDETTNELRFNIKDFKQGDYHLWIYKEEKTFIRNFKIVGNAEDAGLLSKFLGMFK